MKSADLDPAALVHRMRQQLILVQVRIMELEDARDEAGARLAECQELLRAAQTLADGKLDEATHLEKVRADLQAQYDHLRHVQHVTNEALNAARHELADAGEALATERQNSAALESRLSQVNEARRRLEEMHHDATRRLHEAAAVLAAREQRLAELDAEIRTMKTSRSWRWTAWLRALERRLGGRKP